MNKVERDDLDDLALGAVFLATGGGGPHLPKLIAQQALKAYGPVTLVLPDNLDDGALVVPVGSVGAPTVSLELFASINEPANTINAFESHVERNTNAIACFEI